MNSILVNVTEKENRVAIVENERLVEFYIDKKDKEKIVGNIYRGRIVNVLPGMEAAFVDIGIDKNAYLYIKDALPREMMREKSDVTISDVAKVGQEIIVQVVKEPFGNKGPKVTTHITLPGRFVVFTPYSSYIGMSRRITDRDEIDRLKNIVDEIQHEDMGVIVRTAAAGVDKESIQEDLNMLVEMYKKIEREKNFKPCPKLIYEELDLVEQIVRDVFTDRIDKLVVDDEECYESIISLLKFKSSKLIDKVLLTHKDIFSSFNITKDIKSAVERVVPLKSGGYIAIDETEALTSIDVNTGKYIGCTNLEDTVVKTNIEAAEEIARQLRLRDIGGIIIIDFIDMGRKEDIKLVLEKLDNFLKKDRTKTNIIDITKLGLVELTRKKTRNRLTSKMLKNCPYCEGKGKILIDEC